MDRGDGQWLRSLRAGVRVGQLGARLCCMLGTPSGAWCCDAQLGPLLIARVELAGTCIHSMGAKPASAAAKHRSSGFQLLLDRVPADSASSPPNCEEVSASLTSVFVQLACLRFCTCLVCSQVLRSLSPMGVGRLCGVALCVATLSQTTRWLARSSVGCMGDRISNSWHASS